MFPTGVVTGQPRHLPTPSFEDMKASAPPPTILAEIQRIQGDVADMAASAIHRTITLRERLVGSVVSPDPAGLKESLHWPPEGDLGRAYHQAFQLREALSRLHYELGQLEGI